MTDVDHGASNVSLAVSPYNALVEDAAGMRRRPPRVSDCTLRDGAQQVGIALSPRDRLAIAARLAQLGVHELELGTPSLSQDDCEAVAEIAASGFGPRLSALAAAATTEEVLLVKECGVDGVRISFPVSERQRRVRTRLGETEYVHAALEITTFAKEQGLEVIFSPFDTTRADEPLIRRLLADFAREGCVDRVRLVDSVGAATPAAITYLVKLMHVAGDGIPIEVHCHDDFGLATANTLAGALAGAEWLSVTVGGYGERAGNAPLEEVVMALAALYEVDLGIHTAMLTSVAREVESRMKVPLQAHKAVIGRNAFAHESSSTVAAIAEDPFIAEAYDPVLVGQARTIVIGAKSGRNALEYKLDLLGLTCTFEQVTALLAGVKIAAAARGRPLTDAELVELAKYEP